MRHSPLPERQPGTLKGVASFLMAASASWRLTAAAAMLLALASCGNEEATYNAPRVEEAPQPTAQKAMPKPPPERMAPSVRIRVYPDMAVPGRDVVVKVELGSVVSGEPINISFEATSDPCNGEMVAQGPQLTYHVPKNCRGSKIEIAVVVTGEFGEVRRMVSLDIKGVTSSEAVVLRSPLPWDTVVSPVPTRWDRSLYQNRKEKLRFSAKLADVPLFETPFVDPNTVVELDLPPSPERIQVRAITSGGTEENLTLRITHRVAPETPAGATLLHDCQTTPGGATPGTPLDEGGEVTLGTGLRFSASDQFGPTPSREPSADAPADQTAAATAVSEAFDGPTATFVTVNYHVGKKQRYGRKEAPMGVEIAIDKYHDPSQYEFIYLWLRGEKVSENIHPLYVRVKGTLGTVRQFKVARARRAWHDFRFPIKRAVNVSKGERVKSVSVFVDATNVVPPLGLFAVGGIFLGNASHASTHEKDKPRSLPPSGVEPLEEENGLWLD